MFNISNNYFLKLRKKLVHYYKNYCFKPKNFYKVNVTIKVKKVNVTTKGLESFSSMVRATNVSSSSIIK